MQKSYKLSQVIENELLTMSNSYQFYINSLSQNKYTEKLIKLFFSRTSCCQEIHDDLIDCEDVDVKINLSNNIFLSEESQLKFLRKNGNNFSLNPLNSNLTYSSQEFILNNLSLITYSGIFRNASLDQRIQTRVLNMSELDLNKNRDKNQFFFQKKLLNKDVKLLLAWNYGLSKDNIVYLSKDKDSDIREKIARRNDLDEDVKKSLIKDSNPLVRHYAEFGSCY